VSDPNDGPPDPDTVCLVTKAEHEAILRGVRAIMRVGVSGYESLMCATITVLGQEAWDAFQDHVVGYRVVDAVTEPRVRPAKEDG